MSSIDKLQNKYIKEIKEYVPGKSIQEVSEEFGLTNIIKLASNENPFGSPVNEVDIKQAISSAYTYPAHFNHPLYKQLAQKEGVNKENIILGNGSDDIMQLLSLAFLNSELHVVSSECTFLLYHHMATLMGARYTELPLKSFRYDLTAILESINSETRMVFIANPNNPTGTMIAPEELLSFIDRVPEHVIIVIDEAYIEFSELNQRVSCKKLVNSYSNVVFLRTFSKLYGLAGYRIGYGIAHESLINILHKVRMPFNVNNLALEAACLALNNKLFIDKTLSNNSEQKQYLYESLSSLSITYIPTQANFICILHEESHRIVNDLLRKGIVVRHLKSFGLDHGIRVTIGTKEQNQKFISNLSESIRLK